jgi:uncharacterized damage-inducible protein DinB
MTASPDPFLQESARYLAQVYLPRISRALEILPAADLWWRPHGDITSFGNLLLHLEGNVRQWILSGLGGIADGRDRASEFSAREGASAEACFAALSATVREAAELIARLPADELERACTIQGNPTTVRAAVYHVVEHFSWHTGQMVWMAKARAGDEHGLHFYDDAKVNRARN